MHNFGQPDFALVCIRVHMNGRVYEPKLGRMLSPDPVTQAPENGQNYNRYTYAYNNPLKYTDPSGYVADPATGYVVATIANSVFAELGNSILGVGNKCDADCQWRNQANAWCNATATCVNAKNQSRRTRDNKDFKNGNNAGLNIPYVQYTAFQAAEVGDAISDDGSILVEVLVVAQNSDTSGLVGEMSLEKATQNACLVAACGGRNPFFFSDCALRSGCLEGLQEDLLEAAPPVPIQDERPQWLIDLMNAESERRKKEREKGGYRR